MVAATNENVTLVDAKNKEQVATAKTDFLGRFKLYPLRPGEYILLVGNKQVPLTITDDHVRMDVDLGSETGVMDYGKVDPAAADNAPNAAGPSQGTPPSEPAGAAAGSAQPPAQNGAAAIRGCFAGKFTGIATQYWFDGQGRFKNINWNPVSGTFTYTGSYQFDGRQLVLAFDGDETKVYEVLKLGAEGIQWGDAKGSWTYIRNGDVCP